MSTITHGRIASAAIIGISNTAIAEALQAIDKAKKLSKGFLSHTMIELGKINEALKTDGGEREVKIIAKTLIDTFVERYQTPLALRNAHLGREQQIKRFADKAKQIGVDIDFSDVGRMCEIAREGFGADVVALDTRRDTGSAKLDSPGGFDAIKAAPVVGSGPRTERTDGRRVAAS